MKAPLAVEGPNGAFAPAVYVAPDGSISPVATNEDGTAPCCCGGGRWFVYAPCSGSGPRIFVPEGTLTPGGTAFTEIGGFQSVSECYVKQFGPGSALNGGIVSTDYFNGDPDQDGLVYPSAGTLADPANMFIGLSNEVCSGAWPFCGTALYYRYVRCDGQLGVIVPDTSTRTSLDQITCIYEGVRYRADSFISFGPPVQVEWSTDPCNSNDRRIARRCDNPAITITYNRLSRPDQLHVTMLYQGQRYVPTDEESTNQAVTVVWSTQACDGQTSGFYIATRCSNSGEALNDPATVVYQAVQSIGAGNGRVFRTTQVANPNCPDSQSFCVRRTEYQPTTQEAQGPATVGVSHVAGTACQPDSFTCQTCPGDPTDPPVIRPGGPAALSGDDLIDSMGWTIDTARAAAGQRGCCDSPI